MMMDVDFPLKGADRFKDKGWLQGFAEGIQDGVELVLKNLGEPEDEGEILKSEEGD